MHYFIALTNQNAKLYKEVNTTFSMFQGPCEGDSGGPLYIENYTPGGDITGRTVVGIVSSGLDCGNVKSSGLKKDQEKPNYPQWFQRVNIFICEKFCY